MPGHIEVLRIGNVQLLEAAARNPNLGRERSVDLAEAIEKATRRSFPQINAFVYTELQTTGHLGLIRSDALRRDLASHYSSLLHHERISQDLLIQQRFEGLVAGLLTTAELTDIERNAWSGASAAVTGDRGEELARELAKREAALDLLPNMAQHHVFNQKVIELARERTDTLIEMIDQLLSESKQ